ncbi:unnamed protein product [Nesidiocoris tenuis]|uniref:Uncharacterized protein n=1 Tax=Nesidiocoris tenuis TaxID=355587 RepID=A0A6H5HD46_9HEMI|nr:unnamed protein product [Nesidiocoris tenuis]
MDLPHCPRGTGASAGEARSSTGPDLRYEAPGGRNALGRDLKNAKIGSEACIHVRIPDKKKFIASSNFIDARRIFSPSAFIADSRSTRSNNIPM